MSLKKYQNINLKKAREQGFTIVELLIVIIVIAILAALVITAYSNIQSRAKTNAAKSDAKSAATAIAANVGEGTFPANHTAAITTASGGPYARVSVAMAATASDGVIGYVKCTSNGAQLKWYDSMTGNPSTDVIKIGDTSNCS